MKWRRRLLLVAVFVAVFAATVSFTAWWLAHGQPEWYSRRRLDPKESAAAASRAEQQLQRTLSWAQDRQAEFVRNAASRPSSRPAQPLEISLTQDEVNGFFQKWDSTFGWSDRYSRYLSDPQVALRDGRLIFAATVGDAGTVLSIEFQPRLQDGKLYLTVTRVLAGRLPLPRALWNGYRQRLMERLKSSLPQWQQDSRISRDGANWQAVAAAMAELLLDTLNERPSPPFLFLPYDMRDNPRSLPVNVIAVQVADKTLTLTIEPMDSGQPQQALSLIKNFAMQETVPK